MNPERWNQVQLLVEQAIGLEPEARSAFVESACGEDVELRREVVSLLEACERSPDSLSPPLAWFGLVATPAHRQFDPGQQLGRRYRVGHLLGRGGMGEVYEAWDEELSIPVALKILHRIRDTEETHKQLKLEGLLARSVWHPNVCRIYDLGRHEDAEGSVWFLTMELLRGVTLAELLSEEGRLAPDRAQRLAEQMAEGLGAAHRAGVVHRDFKPGNVILVERDGVEQAVVADFGIARALRDSGSPSAPPSRTRRTTREAELGGIFGTPAYMAPEQVRGEEAGPRADIYALGMVLYEMVTGTLPFEGGSAKQIAERRLWSDPIPPRHRAPGLDERWESVILRCLDRDPQKRFTRAEEAADALRSPLPLYAGSGDLPDIVGTLPAERDAFLGRELESRELAQTFTGGARLLTLIGAAGMGKTRLAIHHGWLRIRELPGGVWFADLTEARNLDGIVSALARSLGIQLGRGDAVEHLGHAIAGRGRCLIIFDNFEQVVPHAADTVGRWLARAEEALFLVTSREKLNLRAEQTMLVGSLPLDAGVELFEARARQLRPNLQLIGAEANAAREIVRLVDGMPLAIELAGARMRIMTAVEILAQIRKRFSLLTGGASTRHETLAIAIEGSYELLAPWERSVFAQCAVFEGGFTLEAAEAVIDLSEWKDAPWVVDVVQSLIDKHLLRTWTPTAARGEIIADPRVGMLMSLQEFARWKLREWSDSTPGLQEQEAERRHGAWYARYGAPSAIREFKLQSSPALRHRFDRELENLTAACARAVARGDAETAVAAFTAVSGVLYLRGPSSASLELGSNILRAALLDRREAGPVLRLLGQAEWYAGRVQESRSHLGAALEIAVEVGDLHSEALALGDLGGMQVTRGEIAEGSASLERALEIAASVGDRHLECNTLNTLSMTRRDQGLVDEAHEYGERALEVARAADSPPLVGNILNNLGLLLQDQGNVEAARAHYEEALAIHHEVGYRRMEGNVHTNLGGLHLDQGRLDAARSHLEAALVIHREAGARFSEGTCLINIGFLHHTQGDLIGARAYLEEALGIEQELGNRRLESSVIAGLGHVLQDCGELDAARAHYESALAIQREINDHRSEGFTLSHLASLHLREGELRAARSAAAAAEQRFREMDVPLGLGQILCVRAEIEHAAGKGSSARSSFREAEDLALRMGSGPDSDLGLSLAKLRQLLAV